MASRCVDATAGGGIEDRTGGASGGVDALLTLFTNALGVERLRGGTEGSCEPTGDGPEAAKTIDRLAKGTGVAAVCIGAGRLDGGPPRTGDDGGGGGGTRGSGGGNFDSLIAGPSEMHAVCSRSWHATTGTKPDHACNWLHYATIRAPAPMVGRSTKSKLRIPGPLCDTRASLVRSARIATSTLDEREREDACEDAPMQKPGLGARKCGHCGARIEGTQSHLLRDCPQCRSPLHGRFVPAPHQVAAQQAAKHSGGLGVIVGIVGFGVIATVGAAGYALSVAKFDPSVTASSPSPSITGPVLADVPAGSAANGAVAPKKPPTPTPTSALPKTVERPVVAASVAIPAVSAPSSPSSGEPAIVSRPLASSGSAPSALGLKPTGAAGRCSGTLSVGKFRPSSPTCSFNEKVSAGPGTLEFPCDGGVATANFGGQTFRGTVTAGAISLSQSEPFDFRGCSVVSTQRVFGARASSTATYSYSERVVGGSCVGVSTCTASATVEVR